uniref:HTH_48 domain-containing protein n=1 Tax=Caenorhabditis tropicalis TaxID=1561998 RepID=A0A1I7SYS9_9PELO
MAATVENFFDNTDTGRKNLRTCILYEYLRGCTPREALLELKKAKSDCSSIEEVVYWFARFDIGKYSPLLENIENVHDYNAYGPQHESHQLNQDELKKINEKREDFLKTATERPDRVNKDEVNFFKDLNEHTEFKEIEIRANTQSRPKYISIAMECKTEGKTHTAMSEIYDCNNGVVLRCARNTCFFEGKDFYNYLGVTVEELKTLRSKCNNKRITKLTFQFDEKNQSCELYNYLFGKARNPISIDENHQILFKATELCLRNGNKPVTKSIEVSKMFDCKTLIIQEEQLSKEEANRAFQEFGERSQDTNMRECQIHVKSHGVQEDDFKQYSREITVSVDTDLITFKRNSSRSPSAKQAQEKMDH